jgi:hypothetical protein
MHTLCLSKICIYWSIRCACRCCAYQKPAYIKAYIVLYSKSAHVEAYVVLADVMFIKNLHILKHTLCLLKFCKDWSIRCACMRCAMNNLRILYTLLGEVTIYFVGCHLLDHNRNVVPAGLRRETMLFRLLKVLPRQTMPLSLQTIMPIMNRTC